MRKEIIVKNLIIGNGIPKTCVSIVGKTKDYIIKEANFLKTINVDIIEWRVDFFEHVESIKKIKDVLKIIRKILIDKPIIFTFRSSKEGGEKEVSSEFYFRLNRDIANTKLIDIIDIELLNSENNIKELIDISHKNNVLVIISFHDFKETPSKEKMKYCMYRSIELGADIPKIAVMANTTEDILDLLDITRIIKEKYPNIPIITISMGKKGIVSRITGELFGSSITFASAKKASAPGQIPIDDLSHIIKILHNNM